MLYIVIIDICFCHWMVAKDLFDWINIVIFILAIIQSVDISKVQFKYI